MAFQILPALRALAPIVASATGLGSWFMNRNQDKTRNTEMRLSELEVAVQEQAKTLTQLAEQVLALAKQLQEKEEQISRLKHHAVVAWIAVFLALAAVVLSALSYFR